MAQNLNIIVRTKPAQSLQSNGLNKCHKAVLNEMVLKTMEDSAWSLSSKNTLHNVNSYGPNPVVFGQNPNMPSVLINNPSGFRGCYIK